MILTEAVIAHALAAIPELQIRIVRIRAAAHGTLVVIPLLLAKRVTRKTAVPLGPFLCAGMAFAMLFGEKILSYLGYTAQWPWAVI